MTGRPYEGSLDQRFLAMCQIMSHPRERPPESSLPRVGLTTNAKSDLRQVLRAAAICVSLIQHSSTQSFFMLRYRTSLSLALRPFSSRSNPIMNTSPHRLTATTLLDEERNPDYDPRRFYPARIGDIIQKYQIVSKLGWGTGSTVWLAKDINRFVQFPS